MERNEEKKNIERSHEKDTMHQHQKVTTTPIARGSKKKKYRVTEHWNQSNSKEKPGQEWRNMNII